MATPKIVIPPAVVALGTVPSPDGRDMLVEVRNEWRRVLEDMAKQVNDMQARLTAAGL